jgi:glutathione S-transferase
MLKLYHGPTSVCSQKVRVALAEIGLDYEGELLDLQKGDQFAPDYVRLNPEAVVPTLIDRDLVLVESSLIAEYLDTAYNDSRLMPNDLALEARNRHWLLRCLAVHDAINTLTFSTANRDKVLATKTPEEIEASLALMPNPVSRGKRRDLYANGLGSVHVEQALRTLRRTFADMSAHIDDGTWVSGPAFGLADIGLVAYIDRIDRLGFAGLWTPAFSSVGTWLEAMRARPSYAAAIEAFIPDEEAKAQRSASARYWSELSRRWAQIT